MIKTGDEYKPHPAHMSVGDLIGLLSKIDMDTPVLIEEENDTYAQPSLVRMAYAEDMELNMMEFDISVYDKPSDTAKREVVVIGRGAP